MVEMPKKLGRMMPARPSEPPVSHSSLRRTRKTSVLKASVTKARKWCCTLSAG